MITYPGKISSEKACKIIENRQYKSNFKIFAKIRLNNLALKLVTKNICSMNINCIRILMNCLKLVQLTE